MNRLNDQQLRRAVQENYGRVALAWKHLLHRIHMLW